jgi:hypothetical protein
MEFLSKWGWLMHECTEDDFYFPLDVDPDERVDLLVSLMWYADGDLAIDGSSIKFCEGWGWQPVNQSDRNPKLKCPDGMKEHLAFAHEWYEHYTVNWGLQ